MSGGRLRRVLRSLTFRLGLIYVALFVTSLALLFGTAWWIEQGGAVWLVRRAERGMLGGMAALPGPDWADQPPAVPAIATVAHGFTHFTLDLHIVARSDRPSDPAGWWQPLDQLPAAGLPTLYRRAAEAGLAHRETHTD